MLMLFKPEGLMATHLIIGKEDFEVIEDRSPHKIIYIWADIIEYGKVRGCISLKIDALLHYKKAGYHYVQTF